MNIIVCHNFYQQPGGEDRVFRDEIALLDSRGHRVVPFTMHNDAVSQMSRVGLAARTIWNGRSARQLRDLVRREQADVVHFHNTLPLISPSAYYAARAEGAAVVQTLHNYRLLCPKSTFFRNGTVCEACQGKRIPWPAVRHACYREDRSASAVVTAMLSTHRILRTYINAVDTHIAVSEFSRQKFIEGGLPASKISIKPNFVDPDPGPGRGDGGYAMYLGRLSPEKGIETLLTAWDRLRGIVPLKVVGNGPLAERVAKAVDGNPSITWLPGKDDAEVEGIMSRASFLIVPSTNYEGFPKTIVEALSQGTPVVASRLGPMAEVIDHGRTGLHFDPGCPRDLADRVQQLVADPSSLSSMRVEARNEYLKRYTPDVNYQMLMGIYQASLRRAGICDRAAKPTLTESEVASLVSKLAGASFTSN